MANFIDLVVGKNVESELKNLRKELTGVYDDILKINSKSIDFAGGSTPKSPAELKQVVKEYTNLATESTKATQKIVENSEKQRIADLKLQKQREQAFDKYEKQFQKEQQQLQNAERLYNKVQARLTAYSKEYQDLAVQQKLFNNLTKEQENRMASLEKYIKRYDTTLKGVDATVGKHQRQVGNYALANSNLSGSINQLTREMPAFANSAQTGFMAISNNLPIFFDAISQTSKQIKTLRAEGQQVPSLLTQLAGSFFSLGTVLSVGVTLLTIYGKEIGEFAKKVISGAKSLDTLKESQKQINDARVTGTKNAQEELISMRANLAIAKDVNLSYKERNIAVDNLIKQYPFYFEGLTREQILAGDTAKAEIALTNAILSRAKAQAATTKITENQGKIIDLEEKKLELAKELANAEIQAANAQDRLDKSRYQRGESAAFGAVQAYGNLANIKKDIANVDKEINDLTTINNRLTSYALENEKKSIGLDYQKEKTSSKRKEIEENKEVAKGLNSLLEKLQEEKKFFEEIQQAMSKNNEEWERYQQLIDGTQASIDMITKGTNKYFEESGKNAKEQLNQLKKDTAEVAKFSSDFFKGFVDQFAGESGLPTVFKILRKEIQGFGTDAKTTALAVSEAFQEAFNVMNSNSQAYYDAENQRLEKQKEVAISFAGGSASARAEIERQYDERKRQLRIREAQEQKRMAMFNIAVNTAQAVVAALPNVPLSVAIGIIGAIQLGLVASKPLPQFFKGTDNSPETWAWTQEKGAEIITDKNGRVKTLGSDKGPQLTYMQKGDKVYTAKETKDILYNKHIKNINGLLLENLIATIPLKESNGISKAEFMQGISSLQQTINSKKSITIIEDKRGKRIFEEENKNFREKINNRVMRSGYEV